MLFVASLTRSADLTAALDDAAAGAWAFLAAGGAATERAAP